MAWGWFRVVRSDEAQVRSLACGSGARTEHSIVQGVRVKKCSCPRFPSCLHSLCRSLPSAIHSFTLVCPFILSLPYLSASCGWFAYFFPRALCNLCHQLSAGALHIRSATVVQITCSEPQPTTQTICKVHSAACHIRVILFFSVPYSPTPNHCIDSNNTNQTHPLSHPST